MMSDTPLTALPGEVIDQAIDWSIKLNYNSADAATQAAFADWLRGREENRLAWQRVQSLGSQFASMPSELALQALEKLPEARLRRRQMTRLLVLFAGIGATTLGVREVTPWQRLMADYSTQVGERNRWALADGSLLDLNTDSAVRLHFDERRRELELLRGELHLISGGDPGHAQKRALQVRTPFGVFEALGTRLSVRLAARTCRLGVTEGAVRLQPNAGAAATARAGESWLLDARQARREQHEPADSAAWRDGLLVARDRPLAEVLDELGRYRHGHLGCDPQIAGKRISGNFSLANIDATLTFLAQAHGLQLHYLTRYWVRVSA